MCVEGRGGGNVNWNIERKNSMIETAEARVNEFWKPDNSVVLIVESMVVVVPVAVAETAAAWGAALRSLPHLIPDSLAGKVIALWMLLFYLVCCRGGNLFWLEAPGFIIGRGLNPFGASCAKVFCFSLHILAVYQIAAADAFFLWVIAHK